MPSIKQDIPTLPRPLPGAAVAIIWRAFNFIATIGTHKNPRFAFFYLHPKERCFFGLAQGAQLCFHVLDLV